MSPVQTIKQAFALTLSAAISSIAPGQSIAAVNGARVTGQAAPVRFAMPIGNRGPKTLSPIRLSMPVYAFHLMAISWSLVVGMKPFGYGISMPASKPSKLVKV